MRVTWRSLRNSGRPFELGSVRAVRLVRMVTGYPWSVRRVMNVRRWGCSSGAPPVRSTVAIGVVGRKWRIASMTAGGMVSVRSGEAWWWQWAQCWLQRRPRLIWRVSRRSQVSGWVRSWVVRWWKSLVGCGGVVSMWWYGTPGVYLNLGY